MRSPTGAATQTPATVIPLLTSRSSVSVFSLSLFAIASFFVFSLTLFIIRALSSFHFPLNTSESARRKPNTVFLLKTNAECFLDHDTVAVEGGGTKTAGFLKTNYIKSLRKKICQLTLRDLSY